MKFALALLSIAATPAFAKPDPTCACEYGRTLPAASMIDVPTNALFWRLPSQTPGREIRPYELAPRTDFVVEAVSFTTGSGPDREPPIKPSLGGASIILMGNFEAARLPVSRLHVTVATSADTDVVHLHFIDSRGAIDYYTTPDQLTVCEPLFHLARGHVRLEVTALDVAGNESEPDAIELDTIVDPHPKLGCYKGFGSGSHIAAAREYSTEEVVFALILSVIACGLLFARANARSRTREESAPVAFALPAVEYLARAVRRRSLGTILLLGTATGLALDDTERTRWFAGGCLLGIKLLIDAITAYVEAGRALRLARYEGATAEVRFDEAVVTVGKQRAAMHAAPRLVELARHRGLPAATL